MAGEGSSKLNLVLLKCLNIYIFFTLSMSTCEGDSEHNFIVPVRVRLIIYFKCVAWKIFIRP